MKPALRLVVVLPLLCLLAGCEAWRTERAAFAKCENGLSLLKQCEAQLTAGSLADPERQRLLASLNRARALLQDGMSSFVEANLKTGKNYDTRVYQEALIVIRKKLMELRY